MSVPSKPISRRSFLRGSGGVIVGLPLLEAMIPSFASAATTTPRLVAVYGGVPGFFNKQLPAYGALGASLPESITSLQAVRQHVTLITGMALPTYNKGTTPPPGGSVVQQHYTAGPPSLAGVTSYDAKPYFTGAHTIDQVVADLVGTTTRFKSVQARVQNLGYGYGANGGFMSARTDNGVTNLQAPVISPMELFTKLFSGGIPTGGGSTPPPVSSQVLNRRSVLDLVLNDANKLSSKLSGQDKARLDLHFEQIRQIERSLQTPTAPPVSSGSCKSPTVGADPASGSNVLGGWSNETLRGDTMAEILALALACDLTRAIAWQLTYDQCGLGSTNITGVSSDLHSMSHDVNNDASLKPALMEHFDWHCARFAKLVSKLASLPEGSGSVLDNTFLGMCFGEGVNAHNRSNMAVIIAGSGSKIKLGEHIDGKSEHTARVWISAMNALGINKNTLGEISGPMASILK